MPVEYSPPKGESLSKQEASSYKDFIKKHEKEIKKVEKDFPTISKAAIKDLIFILWRNEQLMGGSSSKVIPKLRRLLMKMTKAGWARYLSGFKVAASRFLNLFKK